MLFLVFVFLLVLVYWPSFVVRCSLCVVSCVLFHVFPCFVGRRLSVVVCYVLFGVKTVVGC